MKMKLVKICDQFDPLAIKIRPNFVLQYFSLSKFDHQYYYFSKTFLFKYEPF